MTTDQFKDIVSTCFSKPPQQREIVLYTGMHGARMIDEVLKKEAERRLIMETIKNCYNMSLITLNEKESLTNMINSPDSENYVLAKEILRTKYELNLQT